MWRLGRALERSVVAFMELSAPVLARESMELPEGAALPLSSLVLPEAAAPVADESLDMPLCPLEYVPLCWPEDVPYRPLDEVSDGLLVLPAWLLVSVLVWPLE